MFLLLLNYGLLGEQTEMYESIPTPKQKLN